MRCSQREPHLSRRSKTKAEQRIGQRKALINVVYVKPLKLVG
jgi:hypothetical protein